MPSRPGRFFSRASTAFCRRLIWETLTRGFSSHWRMQPASHGCFGVVQHPQQAAPLAPGTHHLAQLQVPPGARVQFHILGLGVHFQLFDVFQVIFLGLMQIGQQPAHGLEHLGPLGTFLLQPAGQVEMAGGHLPGGLGQKSPFCRVLHMAPQPGLQEFHQLLVAVSPVGQHCLAGLEPGQLALQAGRGVFFIDLGGLHLAGGHVGKRRCPPRRCLGRCRR